MMYNEAYSTFYGDIRERKSLARQARYVRNGSKSKKCPMSTDNMTRKQWKERNSETVSINMNNPIEWGKFKKLSPDTQREYIQGLITSYDTNLTWLADMFGVCTQTIKEHLDKNGIKFEFRKGGRRSQRDQDLWDSFLSRSDDGVDVTGKRDDANSEVDVIEESCDTAYIGNSTPGGTNDSNTDDRMKLARFSLDFRGRLDTTEIANSLMLILGNGVYGDIHITCNLVKDSICF